MLEHQRDLEELVPDSGGAILQQDGVPRLGGPAGRRPAYARGEAPPLAATEQPLLLTLRSAGTPATQDPGLGVLTRRGLTHEWMRLRQHI
jgi:hypothetical protein